MGEKTLTCLGGLRKVDKGRQLRGRITGRKAEQETPGICLLIYAVITMADTEATVLKFWSLFEHVKLPSASGLLS